MSWRPFMWKARQKIKLILIDEHGDQLLAIDLAEYFGGKKFEAAKQIVFSKLKYSTRNSHTEWSLASVCKEKKTKYKGSIIERLSDTFLHANLPARSACHY